MAKGELWFRRMLQNQAQPKGGRKGPVKEQKTPNKERPPPSDGPQ